MDRSSRLASETVGLIAIFPRLCRSKTGSAARAGSSSKLKNDTVTPHGIDVDTVHQRGPRSRMSAERRCDAGSTRDSDTLHGYALRFLDPNLADPGAGSNELALGR